MRLEHLPTEEILRMCEPQTDLERELMRRLEDMESSLGGRIDYLEGWLDSLGYDVSE